jgi:hypothetical protein
MQSSPDGGWYGVTCDAGTNSRVTSINLANNNVTGILPAAIFSLPSLSSLTLANNSLREVDSSWRVAAKIMLGMMEDYSLGMDDLPNFQSVLLSLQGDVDAQPAPPSGLRRLDLSNNGFTGTLDEITRVLALAFPSLCDLTLKDPFTDGPVWGSDSATLHGMGRRATTSLQNDVPAYVAPDSDVIFEGLWPCLTRLSITSAGPGNTIPMPFELPPSLHLLDLSLLNPILPQPAVAIDLPFVSTSAPPLQQIAILDAWAAAVVLDRSAQPVATPLALPPTSGSLEVISVVAAGPMCQCTHDTSTQQYRCGCPMDTYGIGCNTCQQCPVNSTRSTTTGLTGTVQDCKCRPGWILTLDAIAQVWQCTPCPFHTYRGTNQATCQPCPPGAVTATEGAASESVCFCEGSLRGGPIPNHTFSCVRCQGYTQPVSDGVSLLGVTGGFDSCSPCPAGTFLPNGGTQCIFCSPGFNCSRKDPVLPVNIADFTYSFLPVPGYYNPLITSPDQFNVSTAYVSAGMNGFTSVGMPYAPNMPLVKCALPSLCVVATLNVSANTKSVRTTWYSHGCSGSNAGFMCLDCTPGAAHAVGHVCIRNSASLGEGAGITWVILFPAVILFTSLAIFRKWSAFSAPTAAILVATVVCIQACIAVSRIASQSDPLTGSANSYTWIFGLDPVSSLWLWSRNQMDSWTLSATSFLFLGLATCCFLGTSLVLAVLLVATGMESNKIKEIPWFRIASAAVQTTALFWTVPLYGMFAPLLRCSTWPPRISLLQSSLSCASHEYSALLAIFSVLNLVVFLIPVAISCTSSSRDKGWDAVPVESVSRPGMWSQVLTHTGLTKALYAVKYGVVGCLRWAFDDLPSVAAAETVNNASIPPEYDHSSIYASMFPAFHSFKRGYVAVSSSFRIVYTAYCGRSGIRWGAIVIIFAETTGIGLIMLRSTNDQLRLLLVMAVVFTILHILFAPLRSRALNAVWCGVYWMPAATIAFIMGDNPTSTSYHPLGVFLGISLSLALVSFLHSLFKLTFR